MTGAQKAAVAVVLMAFAVAGVLLVSMSDTPAGSASMAGESEGDLRRRDIQEGRTPMLPPLATDDAGRPAAPGSAPGILRPPAPTGVSAADRQLIPIAAEPPTPAVGLDPGPPPELSPQERLGQALIRRAMLTARIDQLRTAIADAEREGDTRAATHRRALLDHTQTRLTATETEIRDLGGPPLE